MASWTSLAVLSVAVVSTLSFPRPEAGYNIPSVGLGTRAQYYVLHDDGTFKYGYDTADGAYEQAMAVAPGEVSGSFGYRDGSGTQRTLTYIADHQGFRPHEDLEYPQSELQSNGPVTLNTETGYKSTSNENLVLPMEVAEVHSTVGEDGSYLFWYKTQSSSRHESADSHNNVEGRYSFVADDDINREIRYSAGAETGYIAEGDSLPVGPSVPGAESGIPTGRILPILSEEEANALAAVTSAVIAAKQTSISDNTDSNVASFSSSAITGLAAGTQSAQSSSTTDTQSTFSTSGEIIDVIHLTSSGSNLDTYSASSDSNTPNHSTSSGSTTAIHSASSDSTTFTHSNSLHATSGTHSDSFGSITAVHSVSSDSATPIHSVSSDSATPIHSISLDYPSTSHSTSSGSTTGTHSGLSGSTTATDSAFSGSAITSPSTSSGSSIAAQPAFSISAIDTHLASLSSIAGSQSASLDSTIDIGSSSSSTTKGTHIGSSTATGFTSQNTVTSTSAESSVVGEFVNPVTSDSGTQTLVPSAISSTGATHSYTVNYNTGENKPRGQVSTATAGTDLVMQPVPVEVAQINFVLGDDSSYSFFYETQSSSRHESADSHNNVEGRYSFVADDDINREIRYSAGAETGYIAEGDSLPVGPSVPGAESGIPTGRILPILSEEEANALAAATSGVIATKQTSISDNTDSNVASFSSSASTDLGASTQSAHSSSTTDTQSSLFTSGETSDLKHSTSSGSKTSSLSASSGSSTATHSESSDSSTVTHSTSLGSTNAIHSTSSDSTTATYSTTLHVITATDSASSDYNTATHSTSSGSTTAIHSGSSDSVTPIHSISLGYPTTSHSTSSGSTTTTHSGSSGSTTAIDSAFSDSAITSHSTSSGSIITAQPESSISAIDTHLASLSSIAGSHSASLDFTIDIGSASSSTAKDTHIGSSTATGFTSQNTVTSTSAESSVVGEFVNPVTSDSGTQTLVPSANSYTGAAHSYTVNYNTGENKPRGQVSTATAGIDIVMQPVPVEVAQINFALGDDGSYAFSYETQTSSRHESADSHNNVEGRYSFVADDDINREIRYSAGAETGYIAEGDSLPVGPSVPGAESGIPTGRILPILSEEEANALAAATSGVIATKQTSSVNAESNTAGFSSSTFTDSAVDTQYVHSSSTIDTQSTFFTSRETIEAIHVTSSGSTSDSLSTSSESTRINNVGIALSGSTDTSQNAVVQVPQTPLTSNLHQSNIEAIPELASMTGQVISSTSDTVETLIPDASLFKRTDDEYLNEKVTINNPTSSLETVEEKIRGTFSSTQLASSDSTSAQEPLSSVSASQSASAGYNSWVVGDVLLHQYHVAPNASKYGYAFSAV